MLAVSNLGGKIFVIDDECTHGPRSLWERMVEDDVVECNFHNSAVNVATGEVVAPPCMIAIRKYKVAIQGGKVCIDPDQPADGAATA